VSYIPTGTAAICGSTARGLRGYAAPGICRRTKEKKKKRKRKKKKEKARGLRGYAAPGICFVGGK